MLSWLLQAATTGDPALDWLTRAGSAGILAFAVIAFLKGWIVPGRELDQCRHERDRALELVYKLAETSERALEVAEKK